MIARVTRLLHSSSDQLPGLEPLQCLDPKNFRERLVIAESLEHPRRSPAGAAIHVAGTTASQVVRDPQVLPVLRALTRRKSGGRKLLAYKAGRDWVDLRSSDINGFIQECTGGDYTAKDFRPWAGTVSVWPARSTSGLPLRCA